jgi:hypothetical protein
LHAKPYKKGSYGIWSAFSSIADNCIAYLPCDNSTKENESKYDSLWLNKEHRRTGYCHEKLRVMVFDSIKDYNDYLTKHLRLEQAERLSQMLKSSVDRLMPERKKNMPCLKHFIDYPKKIADIFDQKYLKPLQITNKNKN